MKTRAARIACLGLLVLPGCGLLELPFQLLGAVGGALVEGVGSFVGMLGQFVPSATRSMPFLVLSTQEAAPESADGEAFVEPAWARDPQALAAVLESEPRGYAEAIASAPPSATHHHVLRVADFQDPAVRAAWSARLAGQRLLALTPIDAPPETLALQR